MQIIHKPLFIGLYHPVFVVGFFFNMFLAITPKELLFVTITSLSDTVELQTGVTAPSVDCESVDIDGNSNLLMTNFYFLSDHCMKSLSFISHV